MDKVVNYFLLLIIFVFDPLAIALVVAANMAFAQIRKPKEITIDGGEIEVTVEPTEKQMEEVNEGKQFAKGLDAVIEVMEEEEKEKEKVIQIDQTGGHKVLEIPKEDIYKEKKFSATPGVDAKEKTGQGRIPSPPKTKNL
jgi:hypothetical protein